jgi:predicted N-acyltransferase
MADDKKKADLTEKIGLFLDKVLTFGGGLKYKTKQINEAVNVLDGETDYKIKTYKDIKFQTDFDRFKKILDQLDKRKEIDAETPQGKDGGMVIKTRKGNKISPRKPKVAGRLASRGYGKAFKGR